MSKVSIISSLISFLGFASLVVSSFSPGWAANRDFTFTFGLLQYCLSGTCITNLSGDSVGSLIAMALMFLSVLLTFIGFLVTLAGATKHSHLVITIGGGLMIAGGSTAFAGVSIYTRVGTGLFAAALNTSYSYSFALAWVGGALSILGGCVSQYAAVLSRRY